MVNAVQIRGLTTSFGLRGEHIQAVDNVDLDISDGEFFVLLGPSGCGKTTMLRSIAGLERPSAGSISIDGEVVFSSSDGVFVPPEKRPIAMVFQSYAIWPHMDVYENVAFPLREGVRRLPKIEVKERVSEVLELLGMAEMSDRPVTTLSGGQQQRVALARALALQPKVLLMDEPLSNLDYRLQVRLRMELRDLMHRLNLTTVYVTHNQGEALETGDRVAVMEQGHLIQLDSPREIYQSPRNEFVARFIGEMNLVPATLHQCTHDSAVLDTALGRFRTRPMQDDLLQAGDSCLLGIRPEDLVIMTDASPDVSKASPNHVRGAVVATKFIGDAAVCDVRIGEILLQIKDHNSLDLPSGCEVTIHLPESRCLAVPSGDMEPSAMREIGVTDAAPLEASSRGGQIS